MQRFWDTTIEPILEMLKPDVILEIGSDEGGNTQNLLEFCSRIGATLHVVDPLPKYDAADWQERYGGHLVLHEDLSLDAIPRIEGFDVALIDGDHNWYTVFNELKQIERRCEELSRPFPIVMLHDVSWPYGRRDLYYDPETIPEEYRKPYKRRGMHPDSAKLLERGGLNSHLCNATLENVPRSGVLTAVEDFLKETDQPLEILVVPGLHGLGIVVPPHLKQNEGLAGFLRALDLSETAARLLMRVERARIETEIRRQQYHKILDKLKAEREEEPEDQREQEIQDLRAQLRAKETHLRQLTERSGQALPGGSGNTASLGDRQITSLKNRLERRSQDVERLIQWIERLDAGISAILNSRQWKIGHFLGKLRRRVTLQDVGPTVPDSLDRVKESFKRWQERYERERDQPDTLKTTLSPPSVSSSSRSEKAPVEAGRETTATGPPSADVVVCVHNALEDVKLCLSSVVENTPQEFTLYVINDGSDGPTTEYLREFSSTHPSCVLLENPTAEGYTRAANKGLRTSTADYVVLLNSDTLVPQGWLARLLECGESDPRIGIVGPLSNAASWQSVPKLQEGGDWAVNPLPRGYGVDDMVELISSLSEQRFPRVSFVNGFCLVVKRTLMEAIGYLDEEAFPEGYGEENDYCLRAADAGFELAIADHAYIYHAKSKSYSHERRHALRKPGGDALRQKHGAERISQGTDALRHEPTLQRMRQRLQAKLQSSIRRNEVFEHSPFKILFLLPARGGSGGVHSVVQEVHGMFEVGVFAQIAVPAKYRSLYDQAYPNANKDVFYFFDSEETLAGYACGFDIVVATTFLSVKLLKAVHDSDTRIVPAYYIQDYEPWFVKPGSDLEREAKESYTAVPGMLCFAKTDWLREVVNGLHDIEVSKVSPSLDHSVYYPSFRATTEETTRITAMVRPKTPRRAPGETMRVLKTIKEEYGEKVSVTIFGCEPDDARFLTLPQDFEFENRGPLTREGVSGLLKSTDVFLDLSKYQAFGRTGLEAMACGCAVVLPGNCGTSEYARHRDNALLVDTGDFEEMVGAVRELIEDEDLRRGISRRGVLTASEYSVRRAVASELIMFREALQARVTMPDESGGKESTS